MGIDPETIAEEGIDTEELVEEHMVGPGDEGTTEVSAPPEWEDDDKGPDQWYEEAGWLVWGYRGFRISVTNEKFDKWEAHIEVPGSVAKWLSGPGGTEHLVKATFHPVVGDMKEGYIEAVEQDMEATRGEDGANVPPTTIIAYTDGHRQPMVCLQSMVDDMIDFAEERGEYAEQQEEMFEAAKKNTQADE